MDGHTVLSLVNYWPWIVFAPIVALLILSSPKDQFRFRRAALGSAMIVLAFFHGLIVPGMLTLLAAGVWFYAELTGRHFPVTDLIADCVPLWLGLAVVAAPFAISGVGVLLERRWGYVLCWGTLAAYSSICLAVKVVGQDAI